jgi:hypothetical protein
LRRGAEEVVRGPWVKKAGDIANAEMYLGTKGGKLSYSCALLSSTLNDKDNPLFRPTLLTYSNLNI